MFHVNKKTEYALLALGYLSGKPHEMGSITSVREIADAHNIPYSLLAKVMLMLASAGLVKAVQGTKGGYLLLKSPSDITVADAVTLFEGRMAIAGCFDEKEISCPQWSECLMKDPLFELNQKIHRLLRETTLEDLVKKTNQIKANDSETPH